MSESSGVAPMVIRLYDQDNNFVEFTRSFIPWKILKMAVRLAPAMEGEISEAMVDQIAELVVAVFGDQFTVDQLNDGADLEDMMVVIQTVVRKAEIGLSAESNFMKMRAGVKK